MYTQGNFLSRWWAIVLWLVMAASSYSTGCTRSSPSTHGDSSSGQQQPETRHREEHTNDDQRHHPVTPTADEARRLRLRDQARVPLEEACGECHIGSYDTSIPSALDVFDLGKEKWSASMSIAQLADLAERIDAEQFPSQVLPDGRPNDLSADERQLIREYVEHERHRRSSTSD